MVSVLTKAQMKWKNIEYIFRISLLTVLFLLFWFLSKTTASKWHRFTAAQLFSFDFVTFLNEESRFVLQWTTHYLQEVLLGVGSSRRPTRSHDTWDMERGRPKTSWHPPGRARDSVQREWSLLCLDCCPHHPALDNVAENGWMAFTFNLKAELYNVGHFDCTAVIFTF